MSDETTNDPRNLLKGAPGVTHFQSDGTPEILAPRVPCDPPFLPELDINIPPPPKQPDERDLADAIAALAADDKPTPYEDFKPDAIERLERWLEEDGSRQVTSINRRNGFLVILDSANGRSVGLESSEDGVNVAGAKEPGLAATIHAAIDLADKRGL